MPIKKNSWYVARPNYRTGKFTVAVEYEPQQTAKQTMVQAKQRHDKDAIPVMGKRILANPELFGFPKTKT